MKSIKITTILMLLTIASFVVQAQPISMSNGTFNACGNGLLDSGGEGAGGYSANENITMTLCPDAANSSIYVSFAIFNLGTGDQLSVYDGTTVGDPLIGNYTNNDLQGVTLAASFANGTGCLTFVFTSDGTDEGLFAASVSCEPPCDNPVAVGDIGTASPIKICQGDAVTFDASSSTAAAGFNINQYLWVDFEGDTTNAMNFTQNFPAEGEYVYNLVVIDDNDCKSINYENFRVWVSTTPSFAGTATSGFACVGDDVCVDGNVTPETYVGGVPTYGGGDTQLPDNVGECFTSTLDFTGAFPDGATLTDINDLLGICMNVEHSFIGDLVITITSPSGQIVNLHMQGGGGSFFGEPIDTGDPNDGIGTCWEYCFTATPNLGTMADEGMNYTTLPSDSYASIESLNGLLGSELNGIWQLDICDMWGSDDGYLCTWDVSLNPDLYLVEPTEFTPSIGADCDSSFWSGFPTGATLSADCNELCFDGMPTGVYNATWEVVDNFGCEYSVDAEIEVAEPTTFTLGPDITTCGTDLINLGLTIDNYTGVEWDYSINWLPWDAVASSWEMNTTMDPAYGSVELIVEVYQYNNTGNWQDVCPSQDTINISVGSMEAIDVINPTPDDCSVNCTGEAELLLLDANTYTFLWDDNSAQTTQNATGLCEGTYLVEVSNDIGCTDTMSVEIGSMSQVDFTTNNDSLICINSCLDLEAVSDPALGLTFDWDYNGIVSNGNSQNFCFPTDGIVYVTGTDANNCTALDTINITVNTPLSMSLVDSVGICPGESVILQPVVSGGLGVLTYQWSDFTTLASNNVSPLDSTDFILAVVDECGIPVIDTTNVAVVEIPQWVITPSSVEGCSPLLVDFDIPNSSNMTNVMWETGSVFNINSPTNVSTVYALPGSYDVSASISYEGCNDTLEYMDMITVFSNPTVTITTDNIVHPLFLSEFCFDPSTVSNVTFWNWDFGGIGSDNMEEPCFDFGQEEACHEIALQITDDNGCLGEDTLEVCLQPELTVYVPNAFSPDDNGSNESFLPVVSGYLEGSYSFLIYDRWGNLIWETENPTEGWDGVPETTFASGKQSPIGVYVWRLRVMDLDNKENEMMGHLTLIR